MRSSVLAFLPLSILAGSCADDDAKPTELRVVEISAGSARVRVDEARGAIELLQNDAVVSVLDVGGVALATVDAIDDAANYNPYGFVAEVNTYAPQAGFALHGAKSFAIESATDSEVVVSLTHEGDLESRLTIARERVGAFRIELVPRDPEKVAWLRYGFAVPESEAFYGLGEVFDHVNSRGHVRAMQLELDDLESANNEAHVPVPFFIGTRGWGFFVESSFPGAFDMAATDPLRVSATFGTGAASKDGLVGHWYAAEEPVDVTKAYYESTAFPRLPAPWAFGPLVWRDENEDQAEVEEDLETIRDLDLATTGVWIDRPYASGVNTFDFEEARFPNPEAMLLRARDLGFEVALWHTPYLDEEDPAVATLVAEAEAGGFHPPEHGLALNGWGRLIDLTNPDAFSFWQDNVARYTDMGIRGFKLDYGEDVVPSLINARNVYAFADGSDERTMHRGYTLLYHRAYAELLPAEGGLLLTRAGKWGDQVNGPIIWPGDLDATFWKHREEVEDAEGKSIKAVGGLPASIVAGLSLGPSGFPFYGADTGGYRHSPPSAELFRRWFEQTALSSCMQIGTSSNDVAWEFDDEELLDSYRFYTRLHLRLFPYLWTLASELRETGRPIQIPYGLAFPEDGQHPDDLYLLGPSILVAPIVEEGATLRSVRFPEGRWIHAWSGIVAEGPNTFDISAALGRIPWFVRAGDLIPMLRPTIDTMSPTIEPDRVDSLATETGTLWVLTSAGDGARTLYDGTQLTQTSMEGGVRATYLAGETWTAGIAFEWIAWATAPLAVRVDGLLLEPSTTRADFDAKSQAVFFDPNDRGGTLLVKVLSGDLALPRVVTIDGAQDPSN